MAEKYIMFSLDDARTKKLADVISNPTCKKIIDFLTEEKEASENDIARKLRIPINTIEYNLKKLEQAGLIDKSKNFFYSVKGRKIDMYKLSNKKIMIQPKSMNLIKNIKNLAIVLFSGAIISFLLRYFSLKQAVADRAYNLPEAAQTAEALKSAGENLISTQNIGFMQQLSSLPIWEWFFIGILFAVLVYLILNLTYQKNKLTNFSNHSQKLKIKSKEFLIGGKSKWKQI